MTISKEHIIEYFKSGIKEEKDFRIGIEHEKFLFDSKITQLSLLSTASNN